MSNLLRWSDEVSAVVDENDTIIYVVSADVGAMIVGYQRATALAEQRHQLLGQRNTQIGVLQTRVAALEDTIKDLRATIAKSIDNVNQAFELDRQRLATIQHLSAIIDALQEGE